MNSILASSTENQYEELQLNLSKKNINQKGVSVLMNNLQKQYLIKSFHLFLNDNCIGDKGLEELVSHLNNWVNLENLTLLISNNHLTQAGTKKLSLFKSFPKLQKLTLSLSKNHLGEEPANNVAAFISKQQELKELMLVLNECGIGNNGLKVVCQQIRDLKKLEKASILFDENSITNNGALEAVRLICSNKSIKHLNIEICSHKIKGSNYQQEQYNLYYNVISQRCLKQIIEVIGSNKNLVQVMLNAFYYNDTSYQKFQKNGFEGLEKDFVLDKHLIQKAIEENLQNIPSKKILY